MVVCVHCNTPTRDLFLSYGPDHLLSTRCSVCHLFADPYIEQEAVMVAIDLILVKPRAYRHLLFNRPDLVLPPSDENEGRGEARSVKDKSSGRSSPASCSSWTPWFTLARHLTALLLVDSYLRWFYLCARDQPLLNERSTSSPSPSSALAYQSMAMQSYGKVFIATMLQVGTLYLCTLLLSILYHRTLLHLSNTTQSSTSISKEELARFQPHLVLTSLLFAHLTPIFLLSLLLLWHSKPTNQAARHGWQWDENSIDWAIRNLVGGLSSGVALGVVLPMQKAKLGSLTAVFILLTATYLQLSVGAWLQMPSESGIGVLQTPQGIAAARRYCA